MPSSRSATALILLALGACDRGSDEGKKSAPAEPTTVELKDAGEPFAGLTVEVPMRGGVPHVTEYFGAANLTFNGFSVFVIDGPLDGTVKERWKVQLEGATIGEDGPGVLAYTKPGKSADQAATFGWFEHAKLGDASFVCGTPNAAEFGLKLAKEVCGTLKRKP